MKKARKRKENAIALKKSGVYFVVAVVVLVAVIFLFSGFGVSKSSGNTAVQDSLNSVSPEAPDYESLKAQLFPSDGFKTKVVLGNVIPELVATGAIDMDKFTQLYAARGGLTDEQLKLLTEPSSKPLVLTLDNMPFLINLLWALGIANKNPILDETADYQGVANLASTGGWTLGKEDAMAYFNSFELVKLSPQQQLLAEKIAKGTYRPCCNNPTAFPDCNHGAAMLALIELGASQGLSEDELYTLALQANTLWFPQQYILTATLYDLNGKDYFGSAKEIVGADYSSSSGWSSNVYQPLQQQGVLPKAEGGGSCGV